MPVTLGKVIYGYNYFHTVTGNRDGSRNGNVDQSGNGNSNGNGDRNHNDYASGKSDANVNDNVNGLGKSDVAIARTIVMVERSLNDCQKNQNQSNYCDQSKQEKTLSAISCTRRDWFGFCFSLAKKLAWHFRANH